MRFGSTNREVGSLYTGTVAGTYTNVGGVWTDGSGNTLTEIRDPSLQQGESAWGLIWFEHITPALTTPVPTFTLAGSSVYSKPSSGGTALMGMFWGLQDQQVIFDPTANGGQGGFATVGTGLQYEIYAVDLTAAEGSPEGLIYQNPGTPSDPLNVVPGDRTGASTVTGWSNAGSNSVLVASGTSSYFVFNGINTAKTTICLDITGGLWKDALNSDFFTATNTGLPLAAPTDIYMDWTVGLGQTDVLGWTGSDDEGSAVPEPATAVALFLAIGGLGTYIRKRAAA